MSQPEKSCADETLSFSSVPGAVPITAGEKKTQLIFEGEVEILFKPAKPKAATSAKKCVEVTEKSVLKMVGVAIGMDEYDEKIHANSCCWNCTMNDHEKKKKEASSYEESGKITAAAQFTRLSPLIVTIRNVNTYNNETTGIESLDNSPLVMWTMTSLYLHVCLWLGSKLCTGCKNAVFYYLFENFKNIIDSIVNNIKNLHQESRQAMDFSFFKKFSSDQNTKFTGHDSLGNGVVSKEGSANFLWYFFRFLVNGQWDEKYPRNEQIMTIRTSADNKVLVDAKAKMKAEKKTSSHEKNLVDTKNLSDEKQKRADLNCKRKTEIAGQKTFKRKTLMDISLAKKYAGGSGGGGQGFMSTLAATSAASKVVNANKECEDVEEENNLEEELKAAIESD